MNFIRHFIQESTETVVLYVNFRLTLREQIGQVSVQLTEVDQEEGVGAVVLEEDTTTHITLMQTMYPDHEEGQCSGLIIIFV